MCPIRISPEVPVYVSESEATLRSAAPTAEPFVVKSKLFIVPAGLGDHWVVEVNGFARDPGGMLMTERISTGFSKDELTLTTPDDPALKDELGLFAVKIDGVLYEAENP